MKTLIRIFFVVFIVNGIDCLGRVCDNCCDCFKDKKIEETREFEEIKEHLDITAESLVSEKWLKKKQNVILKIFKEKDDNNWSSICGKEKTTIKLEGQGNINLYYLQENKGMGLKMKDQKWAFFEIKINEGKEVYLYCSDVESSKEKGLLGYGIFYLKEHISISVIACNTVNVKNMGNMFFMCEKLKNLDVKKFNTKNVNNMSYMFFGCSSLEILKIGKKFKIEDNTETVFMFYGGKIFKDDMSLGLKKYKEVIDYFKEKTEKEDSEIK